MVPLVGRGSLCGPQAHFEMTETDYALEEIGVPSVVMLGAGVLSNCRHLPPSKPSVQSKYSCLSHSLVSPVLTLLNHRSDCRELSAGGQTWKQAVIRLLERKAWVKLPEQCSQRARVW